MLHCSINLLLSCHTGNNSRVFNFYHRAALRLAKHLGISNMTDQFARQTQEFLEAAKDARIPENMQAMAEDAVEKSRDAIEKVSAATKDNAKAAEELLSVAADGAKTISDKVMRNTELNTEAV